MDNLIDFVADVMYKYATIISKFRTFERHYDLASDMGRAGRVLTGIGWWTKSTTRREFLRSVGKDISTEGLDYSRNQILYLISLTDHIIETLGNKERVCSQRLGYAQMSLCEIYQELYSDNLEADLKEYKGRVTLPVLQ